MLTESCGDSKREQAHAKKEECPDRENFVKLLFKPIPRLGHARSLSSFFLSRKPRSNIHCGRRLTRQESKNASTRFGRLNSGKSAPSEAPPRAVGMCGLPRTFAG